MFRPPIIENEEHQRHAVLVHIIILGTMGITVVGLASSLILQMEVSILMRYGMLLVFEIAAYVGLQYGYVQSTAITFTLCLWAILTLSAMTAPILPGVYNIAYFAHIIPIVIAVFIIGIEFGVLLVVISTLVGMVMIAGNLTIAQGSDRRDLQLWITQVLLFVFILVLCSVIKRGMESALEKAKAEAVGRSKSEIAYRLLVESSLQALAVFQGYRIVFANQVFGEILGYKTEELVGRSTVLELVHPDDRTQVVDYLQKRLADDALPNHYEFRALHKDGHLVWLEIFITRSTFDGQAALQVAMIDITERKKAEATVQTQEEARRKFHTHLRELHDITLALARAETLDELCRQAIELGHGRLGFDRLGLFLLDQDTQHLKGTYGIDTRGQLRNETDLRQPVREDFHLKGLGGDEKHLLVWEETALYDYKWEVGKGWNASALVWDGTQGIGVLVADNLINQAPLDESQLEILRLYGALLGHLIMRLQSQIDMQRLKERFSKVFLSSPSAISITRLQDRKFLDVNPSWLSMFGFRREDVLNRTPYELNLWNEAPNHNEIIRRLETEGLVTNVELNGHTKSGRPFVALAAFELVELEGEACFLTMLQDIGVLKEAEQHRLELALANERVNLLMEFIDKVSHDLKTPLATIETCLYLVENLSDPAEQSKNLTKIQQQTAYLARYIQDVLTISRLNHAPLHLKAVDVNRMMETILERLYPKVEHKKLRVPLELDRSVPPVMADELELDRLLVNLLENALNYTPEEGTVTLRTAAGGSMVVIEVQDSGIGIAAEDLPYIFDRFFRSLEARKVARHGSGLGLAIVKKIVDLHQGEIQVESQEGAGSVFRVRLPIG